VKQIFKLIVVLLPLLTTSLFAQKVKDVANIIGVRDNQLIGYGLIVGLNGTGDGSTNSKFTTQSLANLLQTVNVKVDIDSIKPKNVAAVMVTAKLPPFARQGDKLDVVISSIGDAKSLQGGTLLMTPLKGVDGEIYALTQGAVTIGGMSGRGGHGTVGTIFDGAIIERELAFDIYNQEFASLSLDESSFKTAVNVQNALNSSFGNDVAVAIDPRTIKLKKPTSLSMVEFLAKTLEVPVQKESIEKIVVDEKTGTVVAGVNIKVMPVVITHGEMTLKIDTKNELPVPSKENIDLNDGVVIGMATNTLQMKEDSVTVANVTRALQKLGSSPKDIISILEALKRAGAISATLEIL
jgi:flagellar P-ring protein precursor FlgI